eukprot:7832518-Alexandrium_andersonii.AAC.1
MKYLSTSRGTLASKTVQGPYPDFSSSCTKGFPAASSMASYPASIKVAPASKRNFQEVLGEAHHA